MYMCVNLPPENLNLGLCPPHITNTYRVTIALKMRRDYILKFLIKDNIFFFLMNIVVKRKNFNTIVKVQIFICCLLLKNKNNKAT